MHSWPVRKSNVSSGDLELLTLTLTFEHDLDSVKLNKHANDHHHGASVCLSISLSVYVSSVPCMHHKRNVAVKFNSGDIELSLSASNRLYHSRNFSISHSHPHCSNLTPSGHVVLISVLFRAPTIKSSRSTWAVSPPLCRFRPHPDIHRRHLWPPCGIVQAIIFLPCGFFYLLFPFFFLFSSPNLSGRRLDVYHTSTHGVALVRI